MDRISKLAQRHSGGRFAEQVPGQQFSSKMEYRGCVVAVSRNCASLILQCQCYNFASTVLWVHQMSRTTLTLDDDAFAAAQAYAAARKMRFGKAVSDLVRKGATMRALIIQK